MLLTLSRPLVRIENALAVFPLAMLRMVAALDPESPSVQTISRLSTRSPMLAHSSITPEYVLRLNTGVWSLASVTKMMTSVEELRTGKFGIAMPPLSSASSVSVNSFTDSKSSGCISVICPVVCEMSNFCSWLPWMMAYHI